MEARREARAVGVEMMVAAGGGIILSFLVGWARGLLVSDVLLVAGWESCARHGDFDYAWWLYMLQGLYGKGAKASPIL